MSEQKPPPSGTVLEDDPFGSAATAPPPAGTVLEDDPFASAPAAVSPSGAGGALPSGGTGQAAPPQPAQSGFTASARGLQTAYAQQVADEEEQRQADAQARQLQDDALMGRLQMPPTAEGTTSTPAAQRAQAQIATAATHGQKLLALAEEKQKVPVLSPAQGTWSQPAPTEGMTMDPRTARVMADFAQAEPERKVELDKKAVAGDTEAGYQQDLFEADAIKHQSDILEGRALRVREWERQGVDPAGLQHEKEDIRAGFDHLATMYEPLAKRLYTDVENSSRSELEKRIAERKRIADEEYAKNGGAVSTTGKEFVQGARSMFYNTITGAARTIGAGDSGFVRFFDEANRLKEASIPQAYRERYPNLSNVVNSAGGMAVMMATGNALAAGGRALGGQLALAAEGATQGKLGYQALRGAAQTLPEIGQGTGLFTSAYMPEYDNYVKQAIRDGAPEAVAEQAGMYYATISAFIEFYNPQLFIGKPGMKDALREGFIDAAKNGFKSTDAIGYALKHLRKEGFQEGAEELAQGLAQTGTNAVTNYLAGTKLDDQIDPESLFQQFAVGAILGGLVGGGHTLLETGKRNAMEAESMLYGVEHPEFVKEAIGQLPSEQQKKATENFDQIQRIYAGQDENLSPITRWKLAQATGLKEEIAAKEKEAVVDKDVADMTGGSKFDKEREKVNQVVTDALKEEGVPIQEEEKPKEAAKPAPKEKTTAERIAERVATKLKEKPTAATAPAEKSTTDEGKGESAQTAPVQATERETVPAGGEGEAQRTGNAQPEVATAATTQAGEKGPQAGEQSAPEANAESVRENAGQVREPGTVQQGREDQGGQDLQRPPQGRTAAGNAQEQVAPKAAGAVTPGAGEDDLAAWMAREHNVTRSGADSYYVPENGERVLWPGTTSKEKVIEGQFWYDQLKKKKITGDEYRGHLERLFPQRIAEKPTEPPPAPAEEPVTDEKTVKVGVHFTNKQGREMVITKAYRNPDGTPMVKYKWVTDGEPDRSEQTTEHANFLRLFGRQVQFADETTPQRGETKIVVKKARIIPTREGVVAVPIEDENAIENDKHPLERGFPDDWRGSLMKTRAAVRDLIQRDLIQGEAVDAVQANWNDHPALVKLAEEGLARYTAAQQPQKQVAKTTATPVTSPIENEPVTTGIGQPDVGASGVDVREPARAGARAAQEAPAAPTPAAEEPADLAVRDEAAEGEGNVAGRSTGGVKPTDRGATGRTSDVGEPADTSTLPGTEVDTGRAGEAAQPAEVAEADRNNVLPQDEDFIPSGDKSKIRANLSAIKLLKTLEKEGRNPSPEEKATLSKYVGWGGLKQVFDEGNAAYRERPPYYEDAKKSYQNWEKEWGKLYDEVKAALTEEEWNAAARSILNAHYTSREIINAMWKAVQHLGFRGGSALEPAAGIGHFIGLEPPSLSEGHRGGVDWTAVELDDISGRMLAKLYPQARVHQMGFQDARIPLNSQDLVITNVPFSQDGPTDKRYPNFSLHNYFFARSLDMVKPGGIVAAITSDSTMDSPASRKAREYMAERADLVGAIRLPNNAFKKNAGTEVTTDILFFRKKDSKPFNGEPFIRTVETTTDKDEPIEINQYFIDHPDMMLGRMSREGTMYREGQQALVPKPGADLNEQLEKAIAKLPEDVMSTSRSSRAERRPEQLADIGSKLGSLTIKEGVPYQVQDDGTLEKPTWAADPKKAKQAVAYVNVRDQAKATIDKMLDPNSTEADIAAERKKLNTAYDAYVKKHGHLNERKSQFLDDDTEYPLTLALEDGKESITEDKGKLKRTVTWEKGKIFTERTVMPRVPPEKVDTVEDGLQVSLNFTGKADPAYIAELTGKPQAEVEKELLSEGLAFQNPVSGIWESRATYLSGFVKNKLQEAQRAAEDDPQFNKNVEELEKVQPPRVEIGGIGVRLGSVWVPPEVIEQFIQDTLKVRANVYYTPQTGRWHVKPYGGQYNAVNETTFGIHGWYGHELVEQSLNLKSAEVVKEIMTPEGTKSKVKDGPKTLEAQEKQAQLQREFNKFAKSNPEVASQLEDIFNERYNGVIAPKFDPPAWTHYPGASTEVTLREHQKAVATRMVQNSTLLAHSVGTGKTYAMITADMEMRRLGTANKPMIVVQNATVEQFARSFKKLYPTAKILVPNAKQRDAKNRNKTMSRIATGDWDAVIIPQSFVNMLPDDPEREVNYIEDRLAELKAAKIASGQDRGRSPSARDLQAAIGRLEDRLGDLADRKKDNVLTFEQLGVDALFVDEAHAYKKLEFTTQMDNIKGLDKGSSQRGWSMNMKTRWVQERNGGKNVIFATGTPVSNTIAEAWNMMRYVRPDVLKAYGIETFDQFASTFGDTIIQLEMTAAGTWKTVTRFAKYTNGPELIAAWRTVADVVTAEEVNLPGLPALKNGKVTVKTIKQSPNLTRYIAHLRKMLDDFDKMSGKEKKANSHIPLVVFGLAKKASLDMRMIDPSLNDEAGSKLNTAADEITRIYKESTPVKGAQMVFADSYQDDPEAPQFNLYQEVKKKLIERGIPENEIAILTPDMKDAKRDMLFTSVNNGDVRVILGSTERMGVGVNAQEHLIALHHLDAPPRPMDVEQRNGRIIRQGNMNPQVEVITYGVENTLDAAMFQKLATKQKFINQILRGDISGRNFEDAANEVSLSFEEQMAAFSGDPRAMEKVALENQVRQLESLSSGHYQQIRKAKDDIRMLKEKTIPFNEHHLVEVERRQKEFAEAFGGGKDYVLESGGKQYVGRKSVAEALQKVFEAGIDRVIKEGKVQSTIRDVELPIGTFTLNGKKVNLMGLGPIDPKSGRVDPEKVRVVWSFEDGNDGSAVKSGDGFFHALAAVLERIDNQPRTVRGELEARRRNLKELEGFITQPFEREKEYEDAKKRLRDLTEELKKEGQKQAQSDEEQEEEEQGIAEQARDLAGKIRALKPGNNPDVAYSSIIPTPLIDAAIEIIAQAVETGGQLAEAIQRGAQHIEESQWYKSLSITLQQQAKEEIVDQLTEKVKGLPPPKKPPTFKRPKGEGEGREKRKLAERVMEDPEIPDDIKVAFTEDAIYYDKLPMKVSREQARTLLNSYTNEEARRAIMDLNNKMPFAVRFTMAYQLFSKYKEGGDKEGAAAWGDEFFPLTTDVGQGINALKEWAGVTDRESLLYKAKRDLDKLGVKLTPEQQKELERLADKVERAPEGRPKGEAMQDFLAYQAKVSPHSKWDLPLSIWYAHVLSGPITHLKNAVSNASNTVLLMANILGRTLVKGRVQDARAIAGAYFHGVRKGVLEAANTWKTGKDPIRFEGSDFDAKLGTPAYLERVDWKVNPWKYVRRAMVAADVFFFEPLKEMRAYQLALAQAYNQDTGEPGYAARQRALELMGETTMNAATEQANQEYEQELSNARTAQERSQAKLNRNRRVLELMEAERSGEIRKESTDFATRATYNYAPEGALGAVAKVLNSLGEYVPPAKFIVPFTNIIANVANESINYSPVGFLRHMLGRETVFGSHPKMGARNYKTQPMTEQEKADLMGKAILGTVLMTMAYMLSQKWDDDDEPVIEITANGTGDYRKNYELQDRGWQPYSVRIGKKWYSYQYTPLAAALGLIGNLRDYETYRNEKLTDEGLATKLKVAAGYSVRTLFDQTALSSLNNFLSAAMDPRNEDRADDFARSVADTGKNFLIPNLYTQGAKMVQGVMDIPTKEVTRSLMGNSLKDIPFARTAYFDKINGLGEPIVVDQNLMISTVKPDPIWQMLADKRVWIGVPSKNVVTIPKNPSNPHSAKRLLTDQEYYDFTRIRGALIKSYLQANLETLNAMPAEDTEEQLPDGSLISKEGVQSRVTKIKNKATLAAKEALLQGLSFEKVLPMIPQEASSIGLGQ